MLFSCSRSPLRCEQGAAFSFQQRYLFGIFKNYRNVLWYSCLELSRWTHLANFFRLLFLLFLPFFTSSPWLAWYRSGERIGCSSWVHFPRIREGNLLVVLLVLWLRLVVVDEKISFMDVVLSARWFLCHPLARSRDGQTLSTWLLRSIMRRKFVKLCLFCRCSEPLLANEENKSRNIVVFKQSWQN